MNFHSKKTILKFDLHLANSIMVFCTQCPKRFCTIGGLQSHITQSHTDTTDCYQTERISPPQAFNIPYSTLNISLANGSLCHSLASPCIASTVPMYNSMVSSIIDRCKFQDNLQFDEASIPLCNNIADNKILN